MLRRIFVVLTLLCFIAPLATGAQEEEITLTFSHFRTEDSAEFVAFYEALETWKAEHPNIKLEEEIMSHDEYLPLFNVRAAANELPDVFMMLAANVDTASASGLVADISSDLEADPEWLDLQNPGAMVEWTRGDAVYAVPAQMIVTHLIYYNEEIFKEAGVETFPETWEELEDAIVKLQEAGYVPIALGNKERWVVADPVFGTLIFRATGLDWFFSLLDHEAAFTDPEFVAAVEAFDELVEMGAFNADANSLTNAQQRTLYYNKEAAMFIEGNWAITPMVADAPEDVLANTHLAIWPPLPDGQGEPGQVTGGAGWGYALNANLSEAKHEAAISLVKALSGEEYGKRMIEDGMMAAQLIEEYDESIVPALSVELNGKLASEWTVVPIFTNWTPPGILDVLGRSMQELMIGQASPEDVAQELQTEYERSE